MEMVKGNNHAKLKFTGFVVFVFWCLEHLVAEDQWLTLNALLATVLTLVGLLSDINS